MTPSITRGPAVNAALSDAEPFGQRALVRHGTAASKVPARTEAVVTLPVAPIHPALDHGASGRTASRVGLRSGGFGKVPGERAGAVRRIAPRVLTTAALVMASTALAGCSGTGDSTATATPAGIGITTSSVHDDVTELQRLADTLVPLGDPGVLAHVETTGQQPLDVTAGVADLTSKAPLDPASHFRIGSITKMFTAVVTLQLVAEGRIGLDRPVNDVAPGLLSDSRVTVRTLLNHTSGLGDFPPGFDGAAVLADPRRHLDPAGALEAAKAAPAPSQAPGTKQAYSNLGYLALGAVITKVSGKPTPDVVRERIIDPLHLLGTSWPTSPRLPDPHPHGYVTTKPTELDQVDYTDLDPNGAGAAGALVSTTADLATFTRALTQGRLVRPDLLTLMLTPFDRNPTFRYGLGAQTINAPCPTEYVGHYGNLPGFATVAATTLDGRRQVVIMLTNAPDTTPTLEHAAGALIDRLLCPSGS